MPDSGVGAGCPVHFNPLVESGASSTAAMLQTLKQFDDWFWNDRNQDPDHAHDVDSGEPSV